MLQLVAGLLRVVVLSAIAANVSATQDSGVTPRPTNVIPPLSEMYSAGSAALIVGVSQYESGSWSPLPSIPDELSDLVAVLKDTGFEVVRVQNPTGAQLRQAVQDFLAQYGYRRNARLVFFFAGHGYTLEGDRGFFVPRDAPDPKIDEAGFRARAVSMGQIAQWASDLTARHALFAFDSCFSGTIFQSRGLKATERISNITASPVRMYMSAGGAGDTVPSRSAFTPALTKGLQGEADLDHDGLVTGSELGAHVVRQVISSGKGPTPQYGKSSDSEFNKGDILFAAPQGLVTVLKPTTGVDQQAIRWLMKQLEDAFRELDVSTLQEIWPNVPASSLQTAFAQSVSFKLTIMNLRIAVDEERATVTGRWVAQQVPIVGRPLNIDRPMRFHLTKTPNGWVISQAVEAK